MKSVNSYSDDFKQKVTSHYLGSDLNMVATPTVWPQNVFIRAAMGQVVLSGQALPNDAPNCPIGLPVGGSWPGSGNLSLIRQVRSSKIWPSTK
jgi:hypothetical protein